MLQLKNIVKTYITGELKQDALKDVSINFRAKEFVSILGPSGSGKTTMLNLVGGLDRYTSGDLIINGVSTKKYRDPDWDIYRNSSIGFVFQSYNLIPHQTVLANVELALTLAGVSKKHRRDQAVSVLEKVGLADHIHKKPNQLSGGQMQRVAIARALVNNPDILLADEPTGALDSETSVQVMALLKEISKDKLVIMVTHNNELAEEYSTRIVKLLDGRLISDSNPCTETEALTHAAPHKKVSMSFFTALTLSFNNLKTKKGRTALTAFAGSIGIVGIALILALSSGMQKYINKMEQDTLSSYPITIQSQGVDLMGTHDQNIQTMLENIKVHDLDKVYQYGFAADSLQGQAFKMQNNDLAAFKSYLDSDEGSAITEQTNAIKYGYDLPLQIYKADGTVQVNPSPLLENSNPSMASMQTAMGFSSDIWTELLNNQELLATQYDVLAGTWPNAYNEVVLIVNDNNEIRDITLYSLGLKDADELQEIQKKVDSGEEVDSSQYPSASYSYDDLLGLSFKSLNTTDYYEKADGVWLDKRNDKDYMKATLGNATEIKVVGIVRSAENAIAESITGTVGYTAALVEHVAEQINSSEIVKEQKSHPAVNVFTGRDFVVTDGMSSADLMSTLSDKQKMELMAMTEAERTAYIGSYTQTLEASYDSNLATLGVVDMEKPSSVSLYMKNYDAKESVITAIADYNNQRTAEGHKEYVIEYTDMVGIMTSSISSVIDLITYLLIGFLSVSLVVSSIMIGIITYISVLERTKEIGILRSIGASKRDISRVFNAETVIVGFGAGLIGIGITLLLTIPANAIIEHLSGVSGIAALPVAGAIILIAISVLLTTIAGLIPSKLAAKKDPVVALRTE